MKTNLHLLVFLLAVMPLTGILSQDIHFSQYYNAPQNLNPSLIGIFNGDIRYNVNYRRQWASVPVPYNTVSLAYDQKFHDLKLSDGLVSGGVVFNYDQSGDTKLTWLELGLGGSYTHTLNESNLLTGGVQFVFSQRSHDMGAMTFHNQYDGTQFDPTLDPRENFDDETTFIFRTNVGINYRWQQDSRTKFDLGVGFINFNSPEAGFANTATVDLASRINVFGLASLEIAENFDFIASGLLQIQGEYQEVLFGPGIKHYLSKERGNELAIQLGFDYRIDDAIAPNVQFYYNQWHLGVSYDINNSNFTDATDGNGGPELFLRYIITKVKPREFKICPIY